ncbi:MAG: alpha/beta hydrolase [Sulfuricurvum sp.]|uniref:alpha/beta hydrolase n=1 Tax=Sulfuricurvum sp. TaxID=2025608 RepID=UPI0026332C96|nr:alpha/beta hydrolase [Sulfuricurvum sp.]MDD2839088.1 alpha/beta hydrolase [Sulfuricurvum sp.]MDD3597895.1 alpha/beta hydrolase [Sulfuricurvum sp.]MDD4884025.1 alpha/beta hydrolase [Sulfuricurvum sp.]
MSLIELFTDYILNRKSLKEYVEVRKTIDARGEFNDAKLIQAEENLQRLKQEEPEIYEGMYETLARIYAKNAGLSIEYPIEFTRQILRMYKGSLTPKQVYEEYKRVLEHYHHDI